MIQAPTSLPDTLLLAGELLAAAAALGVVTGALGEVPAVRALLALELVIGIVWVPCDSTVHTLAELAPALRSVSDVCCLLKVPILWLQLPEIIYRIPDFSDF